MKKIIHLLFSLTAFTFVSFALQAQEASIDGALDKMEKAGIINAEGKAYWTQYAIKGKTCEPAKVRELLAATAKYYGDPAGTSEEIVNSMMKKKIVTDKKLANSLDGTARIAGSMLNIMITRIGNSIK